MLKSLCLILTITFIDDVNCKDYTNYTLYKAKPEDNNQLMFLRNLSEIYEVDFWVPPNEINHFVEFVLSPKEKPYFFKAFDKAKIHLTTVIYNIQSEFDKQIAVSKDTETFDWHRYYTLNETYNWLDDFQKQNAEEMEILTLGKTSEGRPIKAVKVVLKESRKRSSVIIEGGIHGREWISPAFVTYMINAIITARSDTDKVLREIAMTYEWFFIPILNPDGFHYTYAMDRLWVKNRYNDHGVNLNTNFPYIFGTVGISPNSSSNSYCGPYPFSESESRALRDFVLTKSNNLEYYISIHSYGQYLIIPYDGSKEHYENYDELTKITTEVIGTISNRYGTEYTAGNLFETRGILASGSSTSWVKNALKVPYVLSMYLRDKEMFGYALPPEEIVPACAETLDGLLSFLQIKTGVFERFDHVDQNSANLVNAPVSVLLSEHISSGQSDVLMKASVIVLNVLFVVLVQE